MKQTPACCSEACESVVITLGFFHVLLIVLHCGSGDMLAGFQLLGSEATELHHVTVQSGL